MTSICPLPPTVAEIQDAFLERVPDGLVAHPGRRQRAIEAGKGEALPVLQFSRSIRRLPVRRPDRVASVRGVARDVGGLRSFRLALPLPVPAPALTPVDFRVAAILAVRNEQDILGWVLDELMDVEELLVYVIDNHSTDSTQEVIRSKQRNPRFLGWEVWPAEPDESFNWAGLLDRKAEVAAWLDTDWAIHNDADEVRRSPWPRSSLRDAIWLAHMWGATLIDFTVVNHLPLDGYTPTAHTDLRTLDHVELGLRPGYFVQQKCWRIPDGERYVKLTGGGHRPDHPHPRVFPLNFRVDHYPVRSQAHGRRKILEDLRSRAQDERDERGWHVHYDHVGDDHLFARPAGSLPVDSEDFARSQAGRLVLRAGMTPDPDFRII